MSKQYIPFPVAIQNFENHTKFWFVILVGKYESDVRFFKRNSNTDERHFLQNNIEGHRRKNFLTSFTSVTLQPFLST